MNMISIAVLCIAFLLFLSTAYLFILNRSSEVITSKLMPAAIVGLVGALLTLIFSLKENTEEDTVIAALIAQAENMTPLEEINKDYATY